MKQGVKGAGKFIIIAVALLAVATIASAQFARKARVKKSEAPALGTFYSLTLDQPPFPFNPFPDLPVYALTNGAYVYDDRTVDYATLRAEQSASLASAQSLSLTEGEGGGGMMMLMGGSGNTNLALSIPALSGGMVAMSLLNAKTNESHDIFSTSTVGTTNAWLYRGRLAAGQTEMSLSAGSSSSSTAYTAANSADSDGDTVPDGMETFSTQTDPNTPDSPENFPPGHPMVALLTEADPDVRVKHVTDNLTSMSYYSFGTAEGSFGTNSWTRGVGGGAAYFDVLQLYPPQTILLWSVAWDGAGNPTPSTFQSMPPDRWFYRNIYESGTIPLPEGHSQNWVYEVDTTTQIELLTGGKPLSTNQHLFVLNVQAADQDIVSSLSDPIATVPSADITVAGEHPDSDGRVWKVFADNQTVDVTPVVTSTHTNYDFTVDATKLKLKILRGLAMRDVTGKMNTNFAGDGVKLTATLEPPLGTLSNVVWTIPGFIYEGFYIFPESIPTNGWPVAVSTLTNASAIYMWADEMPPSPITVSAQINGHTIQAKTTFEVRKIEADWIGTIMSTTAVHNPLGVSVMAFGRPVEGYEGIRFTLTNVNLKGYTGGYSFACLQIGGTEGRWNLANGMSVVGTGFGLDNDWPYEDFGQVTHAMTSDSPYHGLSSDITQLWRDDWYKMILVWRGSSGLIALKEITWSWSASVTNGPTWGVQSATATIHGNNQKSHGLPTWHNNMFYKTFTTNSHPLP